MENENLVCILKQQLFDMRVETLNNYNEILNTIDKFKDEILIKNLKISQLMDDKRLIQAENEKNNGILQLLQKNFPGFSNELIDFHLEDTSNDSLKNNELYKGKSLIAEQINQLEGFTNIEAENYQLPELINMLMRSIINKEENLESVNKSLVIRIKDENQQLQKEINNHLEWQIQLENEIEKLNFEIDKHKRIQQVVIREENEHNHIKDDYLKIKYMYDNLYTEYENFKTSVNDYRYQLAQKEIQCDDSNNIIKILQSNLKEQADKIELANSLCHSEKQKCQKVEKQVQQLIEEYTSRIHEKNLEIVTVKEECSILKDRICSTEAEIESLKHNIITLEYALNEKNDILQNVSRKLNKPQKHAVTFSLQLNDLLNVLSKLEHQMDVMLDNIHACNKKIANYEYVLFDLQNSVQQQLIIKKLRIEKCENNSKYAIKEKEVLLHYQEEIERLKHEHSMTAKHLTGKCVY